MTRLSSAPLSVIVAALLLTACNPDGETICLAETREPAPGAYCGVVDDYDFALDLTDRRAHVTVTLRPAAGNETCALLMSEPTPEDVRIDGRAATHTSWEGETLGACGRVRGDALSVEARATISAAAADPRGLGLTERVDRFGHAFTYMLGWLETCHRFGLCDTDAAGLAHFRFTIAHAPDHVVTCPGVRTTRGTATTCAIETTRAPTYSSYGVLASDALVASPWTEAAGVRVTRFEVPEGITSTYVSPADIEGFLEHVTSVFGPFPYGDELRVVFAPTHWLGFEHPANIVLSDTTHEATTLYANPTRHTLFHEIVHQWAGNRTTLRAPIEFAWKEAIAEYVAYAYEEPRFPGEAAATRRTWDSRARFALVYARPLDEPPPLLEIVTYEAYGTGPMIMLALEDRVGRAALLEGIRVFLASPGARTMRELVDTIGSVAGVDLASFADAYVFGVGETDWPAFEVEASVSAGTLTVRATQHVRAGTPRPAILFVRVAGEAHTKDVRIEFAGGADDTTREASVPYDDVVVDVLVDPDHRMLDAPFLPIANATPEPMRALHP